ncbi:GNAT family N-acetyltransferase [Candidatus Pelagibacter sp.]|nr:GNAT family N-acetyltransferase [Candidatus Pelagibacter sp.]
MISYKVSNLNLVDSYLDLYNKCFNKFNKDLVYLNWLYLKNPMGTYLGIDAFDNSRLVGQVGGIPINFKYSNTSVKTLLLLNTCIDIKYRGGRLFYNLAKNLEKSLIENDYELLIGIGNKVATPAWKRSIQLRHLCKLKTFIGFCDFSKTQNLIKKYNFFVDWNDEMIKWRYSNPINKTRIVNIRNNQLVYSETGIPFVKVYTPLLFNNVKNEYIESKNNFLNLKVFIGLSNEINSSFLFREIPEYLKPSPLNFLYKFLKKDFIIKQDEIFFSYLDFDIF